jgi:coproporphyrinogen III oxidase-like Fe-S oxidoreductase
MLGLYVHIPFCSAICNYCNFNRGLFDAELKTRYVDALIAEIREAGLPPSRLGRFGVSRRSSPEFRASGGGKACATDDPALASPSSVAAAVGSRAAATGQTPTSVAQPFRAAQADTIYFGGGTPSLLEPAEVARIIAACGDAFALAPDTEVTLEANPETVNEARLAGFRAAGVNRLSFGVQSFRDEELRRLSRLHSADRARAAVAEARAAGFDNVSLDLMMWLPEQRVSDWLVSVDEAIAVAPERSAQGGHGPGAMVAGAR